MLELGVRVIGTPVDDLAQGIVAVELGATSGPLDAGDRRESGDRRLPSVLRHTNDTESDVGLPGTHVMSVRRTSVEWGGLPRAAAHDVRAAIEAGRRLRRTRRVLERRARVVLRVEPIPAPLRHVAVHVIESVSIRGIGADHRRSFEPDPLPLGAERLGAVDVGVGAIGRASEVKTASSSWSGRRTPHSASVGRRYVSPAFRSAPRALNRAQNSTASSQETVSTGKALVSRPWTRSR